MCVHNSHWNYHHLSLQVKEWMKLSQEICLHWKTDTLNSPKFKEIWSSVLVQVLFIKMGQNFYAHIMIQIWVSSTFKVVWVFCCSLDSPLILTCDQGLLKASLHLTQRISPWVARSCTAWSRLHKGQCTNRRKIYQALHKLGTQTWAGLHSFSKASNREVTLRKQLSAKIYQYALAVYLKM